MKEEMVDGKKNIGGMIEIEISGGGGKVWIMMCAKDGDQFREREHGIEVHT